MHQLFQRKPIATILDDIGEGHALRRVLGAGDLVMLAIGAVIGAGIFSSIGTAAAGEVLPSGEVVRYGAGPALVLSFILLGAVFWLGNAAALLGPPGFVLWINRFQIAPEERALEATFGEAFENYRRNVRRWL